MTKAVTSLYLSYVNMTSFNYSRFAGDMVIFPQILRRKSYTRVNFRRCLTGKLWSVYCQNSGKNWPHYNQITASHCIIKRLLTQSSLDYAFPIAALGGSCIVASLLPNHVTNMSSWQTYRALLICRGIFSPKDSDRTPRVFCGFTDWMKF